MAKLLSTTSAVATNASGHEAESPEAPVTPLDALRGYTRLVQGLIDQTTELLNSSPDDRRYQLPEEEQSRRLVSLKASLKRQSAKAADIKRQVEVLRKVNLDYHWKPVTVWYGQRLNAAVTLFRGKVPEIRLHLTETAKHISAAPETTEQIRVVEQSVNALATCLEGKELIHRGGSKGADRPLEDKVKETIDNAVKHVIDVKMEMVDRLELTYQVSSSSKRPDQAAKVAATVELKNEPDAGGWQGAAALRMRGAEMAAFIQDHPKLFSAAAAWFKTISAKPKSNAANAGPAFVRLNDAWATILKRWRGDGDTFHSLDAATARQIVLLGALTFDCDFDGTAVGLTTMPYEVAGKLDGRGYVWAAISPSGAHPAPAMKLLRTAWDLIKIGATRAAVREPMALTSDHETVLKCLARFPMKRMKVSDVVEKNGKMKNKETVGRLLRELKAGGLVERDLGRNKGYALSTNGRIRALTL